MKKYHYIDLKLLDMNDLKSSVKQNIVLASVSPQREALLNRIVDNFTIIPSLFDESTVIKWPPEKHVLESAYGKANNVVDIMTDSIIIAADTIVVFENFILGKPADKKDAVRMLEMLSGNTHYVYTGVCVIRIYNNKKINELLDYERSSVKFRNLSKDDIIKYIDTGEYLNRAGSYAIQEKGFGLVENYTGDFDNIVGLPLKKLSSMLEKISL